MLTVRRLPVVGLSAVVVLLAALWASLGLSPDGWAVGLLCGVVVNAVVGVALVRTGSPGGGPADLITLTRAVITCALAALTADALAHQLVTPWFVPLTVVALVLDAVDGWVARRTGTMTAFGGRFDGEVDAFLILVLTVYVAPDFGAWVLAGGLVRYAFAVAGWVLPWMRARLTYRHWRKVVTATQGIVLAVAAADVVPRWLAMTGLVLGLALLAESFGRDVCWLWSHRVRTSHARATVGATAVVRPEPRRSVVAVAADSVALVVVWVALLAPNQPDRLTPMAFLRLPVEGIVLALLALALSRRTTRAAAVAVAVVVGVPLGVLSVLKVLGLGFFGVVDRPFIVVDDAAHLRSALGFVSDSFGPLAVAATIVGAVVLAAVLLVGVPLSVGRLARLVQRRRRASLVTVTVLAVVWSAGAASGMRVEPHEPLAAADAVGLAVSEVQGSAAALRRHRAFDAAIAADAFHDQGTADLAGLKGKDVVVAFVESYGRVAVEGPSSAQVQAVLDAGSRRLEASGFGSRSAFLTSPTFGGVSWLAHATFQSGLWVDNQWSHDRLLSSDRTSLSRAFGRTGWRTLAVLPSNRRAWPEGQAYYGFDTIHDASDLGYAGPRFGFSSMPDQYALQAFQRLELSDRDRAPVMAELVLASSHGPWAPLPTMVDWDELGDGSAFDDIHGQAESAAALWSHRDRVPAAYMASIEYTITALISFVETYGDDNLVLVLLGDHQPATIVSGFGGNHDVPVTLIARDPEVLERISAWGWQDGLRPEASAPVWRMDAFRDRFLAAYSGSAGVARLPAAGAVAGPGTVRR